MRGFDLVFVQLQNRGIIPPTNGLLPTGRRTRGGLTHLDFLSQSALGK